MEQTRAFYYWAVINHDDFEFMGDRYKITRQQLQDFRDLAVELLDVRDESLAQEKLPPYPEAEIDESYWDDLEQTMNMLSEQLSNQEGSGNYYYFGTLPSDEQEDAIINT
jgi:hypothetical protein